MTVNLFQDLTAERRAGELLKGMADQLAKPSDGAKFGANKHLFPDGTSDLPARLEDFGITRKHAMKWRQLAGMEAEAFEEHLSKTSKRVVSVASGARTATRRRRIKFPVRI